MTRIRRYDTTGQTAHGTPAGYRTRGCRCQPCKDAVARAGNRYKLSRMSNGLHEIDATGTRRRILALGVIGWTQRELARESGVAQRTVGRIATGHAPTVHVVTAAAIRVTFGRLELTRGTGNTHTIRAAIRCGGHPPLAWDDDAIDNPRAEPDTVGTQDPTDVDLVAVARAVDGRPVTLTDAEKREAVRRLVELGVTDEEIGRRVGLTDRTVCRWRAAEGLASRWVA